VHGQNTKPGSFVVRLQGDKDAAARALRKVGTIDQVTGHDGLMVVHVSATAAEAGKPNSKPTWDRLRKRIGAHGVVQPVLTDDNGVDQLPTGEIGVRFTTPLTDGALKRFAISHDLRLLARNEYVPRQAVFAPIHPHEQYLPDLIQSVMGAKNVELAWATTLGQYRRATRA